jgi:hypothetical protein
MPARRRDRTGSGAAEPCTDIRARSARSVSLNPCSLRAIPYCTSRREPKSSGSSAPSATGTPASNSLRSGTSPGPGATPSATLEDGQTSRVTAWLASRLTSSWSAAACTPWPIRPACSSSRQASTLAGPTSSPPCGTASRPPRSAMRKAGAKSPARPRRSSLLSPNPVTPRPAYRTASRARVRASSGCRVRLAAMMTPIPTPVCADAAAAASRTSSTVGVRPPNRPA